MAEWDRADHIPADALDAVNPSGLAATLLVRHGTDPQRERWLPALGPGGAIAAFSITEPQAGSDLQRLEMDARSLGGIGFTWEHDLLLWLERGPPNAALWGDARSHRERVAELAGV